MALITARQVMYASCGPLLSMFLTKCNPKAVCCVCVQVGHLGCAVHAGINSFFAGLAGSLPNTTFAQNNGVLALTRCASRSAGYSCGIWLFLFGVLAKVPCNRLDVP